jgi:hypothetical protein
MVVVASTTEDLEDFAPLLADVAHALGVVSAPKLIPREVGGETAIGTMLALASAAAGPMLVLPVHHEGRGVPERLRRERSAAVRLRRVLVPSDASEAVAAGTRALYRRLSRAGVQVTMLHVMTEDSTPRIWEGSGHHAAAWFDEMRRRHGPATSALKVVTGDPWKELHDQAGEADLVVLFWRHDSRAGHAAVIRALFAQGIEVPKLLVPLEWIEGGSGAAKVPEGSASGGGATRRG